MSIYDLHYASYKNCVEAIRCLVKECGANPNQTDYNGFTPLHIAARYYHVEAIRWFLLECNVKYVSQLHSLKVNAYLKDGTHLSAREPQIDAIIAIISESETKCGMRPLFATE